MQGEISFLQCSDKVCDSSKGGLIPAMGHHHSTVKHSSSPTPPGCSVHREKDRIKCWHCPENCIWQLLPLSSDDLWDQQGCCMPLPLSPVPTWASRALPLVTTVLTTTAAFDPREWGIKGYHPVSSAPRAPLCWLRGYNPSHRGRCPPDRASQGMMWEPWLSCH